MAFNATIYNVFIASPSDVSEERDIAREVIYEWNELNSDEHKTLLQPIRWETHSFAEMGDRPQAIVTRQIVAKSDVLVAVFWARFGSPTGTANSRTVEEIEHFLNSRKPAMIFFSTAPVPNNVDITQLEAVRKIRQHYSHLGLIATFKGPNEFREAFRRNLALRLTALLKDRSATA